MYTYDGAGNVTQANAPAAVTFYSWDAHNRMATATPVAGVVTFAYDGIGRRVQKRAMGSSVQFVWDYEKVLQEADGVGATRTQYLTTDKQFGDLVSSFGTGQAPSTSTLCEFYPKHFSTL